MNTIQSFWESFSKDVIPEDAPEVQRKEMKRSFYAGCYTVLQITYGIGDEAVSEEAGIQMLETLHQESRIFLDRIGRGLE